MMRTKIPRISPGDIEKAVYAVFSHPDFTVGFGITPNHAQRARGLYRRSGFSPCPEDCSVVCAVRDFGSAFGKAALPCALLNVKYTPLSRICQYFRAHFPHRHAFFRRTASALLMSAHAAPEECRTERGGRSEYDSQCMMSLVRRSVEYRAAALAVEIVLGRGGRTCKALLLLDGH